MSDEHNNESNQPERQFVEEATLAMQGGALDRAVELADQGLAINPANTDALIVKAIALSQLGREQLATETFRQAIASAPQNAKVYYNFAVHLFGLGHRAESAEMCREAVRLDPSNGAARDLLARFEAEAVQPAPQVGMPPVGNPYPMASPAPNGAPAHSLKFVQDLGSKWLVIGWIMAVAYLALTVYSYFQIGPMFSQMMAAVSSGDQAAMEQMQAQQNPVRDLVSYLLFAGILAWSIMDIMDRRNNWWWLVVVIGCCVCMPLTFPIYLLAGRKA